MPLRLGFKKGDIITIVKKTDSKNVSTTWDSAIVQVLTNCL